MSSDDDQRENRFDFYLKKAQFVILNMIGVYASVIGIMTFHDDVENMLEVVPKKVETIENKVLIIEKHINEAKAIEAAKAKIKEDQSINMHNDEHDFIKVRISRAPEKNNALDKNIVSYDPSSRFFQKLKEDDSIQHYKVIFKNHNNDQAPEVMIKLSDWKVEDKGTGTDITFKVSPSIFYSLGGRGDSAFLEVKAKIIPYDR